MIVQILSIISHWIYWFNGRDWFIDVFATEFEIYLFGFVFRPPRYLVSFDDFTPNWSTGFLIICLVLAVNQMIYNRCDLSWHSFSLVFILYSQLLSRVDRFEFQLGGTNEYWP